MMDPAGLTLGQVSSTIRDLSVIGAIIMTAWKARGLYESITDFFERTTEHMNVMEAGMSKLLTNHLAHIEANVERMAHRQVRASDLEQHSYRQDDEQDGLLEK